MASWTWLGPGAMAMAMATAMAMAMVMAMAMAKAMAKAMAPALAITVAMAVAIRRFANGGLANGGLGKKIMEIRTQDLAMKKHGTNQQK